MGCIIYEMCAQRPLFTGSTREQLNTSISEQQLPQFPDMFSADLSHIWERLVELFRSCSHSTFTSSALNDPHRPTPSQTLLGASESHQNRSWSVRTTNVQNGPSNRKDQLYPASWCLPGFLSLSPHVQTILASSS